ncbi:MAG: hypothetical protein ACREQM_08145 [Candidatus Dormibacteraceae bacterium]
MAEGLLFAYPGAERIDLDGREPLVDVERGALGDRLGLQPEVFVSDAGRLVGIDVGVGADALAHSAAEQPVVTATGNVFTPVMRIGSPPHLNSRLPGRVPAQEATSTTR